MKILLIAILLSLSINIIIAQNKDFDLESTFNKDLTQDQRQAIKDKIYDYSQMINADSNDVRAYINRGVMYSQLGLYPDAISDYHRAIRIDSTIPEAYYNRGVARARFRYTKMACIDVKRAAEMGLDAAKTTFENNCGLFKSQIGEIKK